MITSARYTLLISWLVLLITIIGYAGGISVDAGLTPGQDRWMLRMQYRYANMKNPDMSMQNHMVPLIVAYGLTPDITLMARLMYVNRIINNNSRQNRNGWNDPFFLVKYKVYRKNTSAFVLGVAPYVASNVPSGNKAISKRLWNPELGLSASLRPRFWSIDLNVSYLLSDLTNKVEENTNDQLNINMAVSSIIPLGSSSVAISPVFEMTYNTDIRYAGSKHEVLFISPGFMYIKSSFILEILYQYPAYQHTGSNGLKSDPRFISGLRYMF